MRVKAELHTHSNFDPVDQIGHSAFELIHQAAQQGFHVLSITCHDALQWSQPLQDYAVSQGVLLIPGVEATIQGRHVLIYGLEHYEPLKDLKELRALRQAQPQIVTIAPHPFFPTRTSLGKQLLEFADCFDALEYSYFYTRRLNFNQKTVFVARSLNKPLVGASDVHFLNHLGMTFSRLTVEELSYQGIAAALRAGKVEVNTRPLTGSEFVRSCLQMITLPSRRLRRHFRLSSEKPSRLAPSLDD